MSLLRIRKASLYGFSTVFILLQSYAVAYPLRAFRQNDGIGIAMNPSQDGGFVSAEKDSDFEYWMKLIISAVLILLGGVFAGLTIGLMGCDDLHLQVLEQSGDASERVHARKVLKLLRRGKHWVLVTLLLGNVIVNETLPIVFDSIIGGGWPAVLISTAMIVIFGEVIPQATCVRYGLSIGAKLEPIVLFMMYLLWPIAYPTALILDACLGESQSTMYKKSGLKTLVTLHRDLGIDKLNQDEVTIITAVLDLREKHAESIMTPIEDVFTLPMDRILDEDLIGEIICAGYSRIPVHKPGFPHDFIGMLLTKTLIGYDPDDKWPVGKFALATLPQTWPDTSCLDLLNYCQEGKSHMILISNSPGEPHGAIGVITLEDIIEELIGEEIIDETDVYIDVHKGLPRVGENNDFWNRMLHRSHLSTMAALHKSQRSHDLAANEHAPILNPKNSALNPRLVTNDRVKVKSPSLIQSSTGYGSMSQSPSRSDLPSKISRVNAELQAHGSQRSSIDASKENKSSVADGPSSQAHNGPSTQPPEALPNGTDPSSSKTTENNGNQQLERTESADGKKDNSGSISSNSSKTFTGKRVRLGNVIESNVVSPDGTNRIVIEPFERSVDPNNADIVEMVERNGIVVPKVTVTSHEDDVDSVHNTPMSVSSTLSVKTSSSKVPRNKRKRRKGKSKK